MALIADDLLNELAQQLQKLGLEITGDDVAGFTIRCADGDLLTRRGAHFGTAAEAAAVALIGLLDRVGDLVTAAAAVSQHWERGDLAAAVRELDVCLNEVAVSSDRAPGLQPEAAWLRRLD
jgi:hypothetical protein